MLPSRQEKYDNPVASRDALLMLLEQSGRPLTHADVCEALGETDEDRVEAGAPSPDRHVSATAS